MNRLIALAVSLLLLLTLFAACSQNDSPVDPVSVDFSADKKPGGGPIIQGDPTELEMYHHQVFYSFEDVDEYIELDFDFSNTNRVNSLPLIENRNDLMVTMLMEVPDGMPSTTVLDSRTISLYVPAPPEDGGYSDVFGDNIIFKVAGMPGVNVAKVTLFLPICPWNHPDGLAQTMYHYSLEPRDDSAFFDPYNVYSEKFGEFPLPPGNDNFLSFANPGCGEPDDNNTTVVPPVKIPVVGDDEDPFPPPGG